MTARRLILRDREAAAWQAGMLSAVVRPFRSRYDWYVEDGQPYYRDYVHAEPEPVPVPCPLGATGQRLWIAETWGTAFLDGIGLHTVYKADGEEQDMGYMEDGRWKSPAAMPKAESRCTVVHLGSRLVRVQSVTEDQLTACGILCDSTIDYRRTIVDGRVIHSHLADRFRQQFVRDHGQAAWDANSWVWVHRIGGPAQ